MSRGTSGAMGAPKNESTSNTMLLRRCLYQPVTLRASTTRSSSVATVVAAVSVADGNIKPTSAPKADEWQWMATVVVAVAVADDNVADGNVKSMPAPKADEWKWEESEDSVLAYSVVAGLLLFGLIPGLQSQSGLLAPILASVSLFGLYLIIKYLPDFSFQGFLDCYFWLLAAFSTVGVSMPLLRKLGGPLGKPTLSLPVPEGLLIDEEGNSLPKRACPLMRLRTPSLSLVAVLIASDILQLIGLRSFRTAGLVLIGLLAYDVFWVFGSEHVFDDNVMLTVATSDMISGGSELVLDGVNVMLTVATPDVIGGRSEHGFEGDKVMLTVATSDVNT
eukprot:gene3614-13699_t